MCTWVARIPQQNGKIITARGEFRVAGGRGQGQPIRAEGYCVNSIFVTSQADVEMVSPQDLSERITGQLLDLGVPLPIPVQAQRLYAE